MDMTRALQWRLRRINRGFGTQPLNEICLVALFIHELSSENISLQVMSVQSLFALSIERYLPKSTASQEPRKLAT